jgi:hypothetical protein
MRSVATGLPTIRAAILLVSKGQSIFRINRIGGVIYDWTMAGEVFAKTDFLKRFDLTLDD